MIGLYCLIGALVLLATVSLLGFVGCGFGPSTTSCLPSPPADYPTAVITTGDLLAYWRLGEPSTTPVPSSGGAARSVVADENGDVHHGDYFLLDPVPADDLRHSPSTIGKLMLGQTRGLLELGDQVNSTGMDTDGGYVQVPWADELNWPRFTFEAWVLPSTFLDPKYFYCLAESTGPQGLGPKQTGWGLYLGPSDPNNPPTDPSQLRWQVWMGNSTQFIQVAIAKPDFPKNSAGDTISPLRLTYLALTFDGAESLRLFLYYPDANQDFSDATLDNMQALTIITSPIDFYRNDTSTAGMGDFFIGTGSNLTSNPFTQRLYPFKGKIQEVALYKRDLSDQSCPLETLASHELSGGNL